MDLVTLTQMKEHLNIPTGVTDYDAKVQGYITEVSKAIETYCDRSFESLSRTETYNYYGENSILLGQYPVTSITGVFFDTQRVFDAESEIDSGDYYLMPEEGLIGFIQRPRDYGRQILRVTYDSGYAAVPSDVQLACKLWVEHLYRVVPVSLGISSKSKQEETVSYLDKVPDVVTKYLTDYVKGHEWNDMGAL